MKLLDFKHLSEVLDKNRKSQISEEHWISARKMIEYNHKRFKAEEKALIPDWKTIHTPFDI